MQMTLFVGHGHTIRVIEGIGRGRGKGGSVSQPNFLISMAPATMISHAHGPLMTQWSRRLEKRAIFD